MKAVVLTQYGPPEVLQLQEIDKPTPKDDQVLIKVRATTVTAGDCELRSMRFPIWLAIPMRLYLGVLKPRRTVLLGQEVAGEVEAVGKDVTRFKVGDAVFGTCGFGFGACAEYLCLAEDSEDSVLALMPENMSFAEAAATPTGGLEALHFFRAGELQRGETVLINGAGGMIGTAAVQLAKYYGAEATVVDRAEKLDMLRDLGADHVIDYTVQDFTQSGQTYDLIFDVIAGTSFSGCIRALKKNGRLLLANPRIHKMLRALWISRRRSKKVIFAYAGRQTEDLLFLKELIEAGQLKTVIDRTFTLEQTVEAHRYVDSGQKQGNVVIMVGEAVGDSADGRV